MSAQIQLTPAELEARLNKAGDEPLELLPLLPLVDAAKAKELRPEIYKKLLDKVKPLGPGERLALAKQVAPLLPTTLTPTECAELLGKAKKVSRQLLYRRWLEQWHYEQPLPLVLTFEHPHGLPPRLLSVQAEKNIQP